jgi:hypothetical protein
MAYYVRVKPEAPGNLKYVFLGEALSINPKHAFGLAVAIWCICWENEFHDGRLKRFTPKALAKKLDWEGDADKLVNSLLKAVVLEKDRDGTLVAHDFEEEQRAGINIKLRNDARSKEKHPLPKDVSAGATGDDSVVKVLLNRMNEAHTPGPAKQHRSHIEAWRARGITGADIEAAVMNNPGKNVFELEKLLVGKNGAAATTDAPLPSLDEIRKKFGRSNK